MTAGRSLRSLWGGDTVEGRLLRFPFCSRVTLPFLTPPLLKQPDALGSQHGPVGSPPPWAGPWSPRGLHGFSDAPFSAILGVPPAPGPALPSGLTCLRCGVRTTHPRVELLHVLCAGSSYALGLLSTRMRWVPSRGRGRLRADGVFLKNRLPGMPGWLSG